MFLKSSLSSYVVSLDIENLKCFKDKQSLLFADEKNRPYRWTVILGENGTGKTTVLRGLFMTAESDDYYNKNRYIQLLGFHEQSTIKIHYLQSEKVEYEEIRARKRGKGIELIHEVDEENKQNNAAFIIAYGANRIGEKESLFFDDFLLNESTLINEDSKLIDVERYFLDLDYLQKSKKTQKSTRELGTVQEILKTVLPDVDDIKITTVGRSHQVEFLTHYGWVKFRDMSLGYQNMTAWMVDLAVRMFEKYPNHKNPLAQPAVVIVDEIDLHMHPRWQQKIIQHLTNTFQRTQFIVTAHSPLIVQSATEANVIVLKRKDNQVIVENDPISVKNWRIDQILASDLFGVSPRNIETTKDLTRRKDLLSKKQLSTNEKKELAQLEKKITSMPSTESPEMIKAMELIRIAASHLKK